MLRRRHRAIATTTPAAALAAVIIVLSAASAHAGIYGSVDCSQSPTDPRCNVTAGKTTQKSRPAAGNSTCHNQDGDRVPCAIPGKGWYSATEGCYYRAASSVEAPGPAVAGKRWFLGTCGDPVNGFNDEFAALAQFTTAPGPETIAQQAISMLRLPKPVIGLNPSANALQVVRVPSWLWVGSSTWRTRTATASAGGVVVTATARPAQAVWSTGDGGQVTCAGPGTVWTPSIDPALQSPTCGHTYLRPSPSAGGYLVSATITWEVTWTGKGAAAGTAGTAGPLTSSASVPVRVVQSSSVNVNETIDGARAEASR